MEIKYFHHRSKRGAPDLVCGDCGSVVQDTNQHTRFHADLLKALEQLYEYIATRT